MWTGKQALAMTENVRSLYVPPENVASVIENNISLAINAGETQVLIRPGDEPIELIIAYLERNGFRAAKCTGQVLVWWHDV